VLEIFVWLSGGGGIIKKRNRINDIKSLISQYVLEYNAESTTR
jgi:hypothetical protein